MQKVRVGSQSASGLIANGAHGVASGVTGVEGAIWNFAVDAASEIGLQDGYAGLAAFQSPLLPDASLSIAWAL
jgi:hypothetical protein